MADKSAFIAACGVPDIVVAACNSIGTYVPVRRVEEGRLENVRPEGWLLSAEVFIAHMEYLMPYRRHVLVMLPDRLLHMTEKGVSTVSLYDTMDRWAEAIAGLNQAGSPFGGEGQPVALSAREKDVIALIAKGFTAKEIADQLGISANTVVTHRKNLTAKLGIKSTSGLSLYAMMNGLL